MASTATPDVGASCKAEPRLRTLSEDAQPCYPLEVESTLMNLDTNSATGWDTIPTAFLKMAKDIVVPIISKIINLSFEQGTFPEAFKQSIITPVYKSGNRDDITNYRPISVLTVQSTLGYCIPVWGGAAKTRFLELERAQRCLMRVMYSKPYRFPTTALYEISGLLTEVHSAI
ncbi:uncharacterized protein LOC126780688 [Nymphalis io]|uniref:uncharacterized protein LOC126780688 n=1 Tax=Inachis io TaxID=171585 RepID=UPI002166D085|nr:uncharacterized protein LOC126780688 [Nymphalis io]